MDKVMAKNDAIGREGNARVARQRFLDSIPEKIKEAYSDEVVKALAKQFGIDDQDLMQRHLYLTAKFYVEAKKQRAKLPPSDVKKKMTAISNKATALLRQLSRLDPVARSYLEQAESLMMQVHTKELTPETANHEHPDPLLRSEDKTVPWPTLGDIETDLEHLRVRCELILSSLQSEKGGKPPNKAMPIWVRSAERLLEEVSGKTPGPKQLLDFCYEALMPIEDEPNLSAIEETIKVVRKAHRHRAAKV